MVLMQMQAQINMTLRCSRLPVIGNEGLLPCEHS